VDVPENPPDVTLVERGESVLIAPGGPLNQLVFRVGLLDQVT